MKQRSSTLRDDLGSLALFAVVAEESSFTRAAAGLGLQLLTRTTGSVAPTQAGERLLETLRPALDQIDDRLAALTELRERPAGNIRITTSAHAAFTILWPAIERLTVSFPDISVELSIEAGFTDIIAERFDAGVRLGQRLEQDMIAMRIGPRLRMATVCSPAYLARYGRPMVPQDLADHACINLRMPNASVYAWEYEKAGRELNVKVGGQLLFNDVDPDVHALD